MEKHVEVGGHQVSVEVRGPDAARTVVLVHNLTGDRHAMIECCDAILAERGLRRLYLDLPGHGLSRGNVERASADHLVDALSAVCTQLAPRAPLVVGYSYGAYLALGLAGSVELSGLLLVCPVVEPDVARRTRPPRRVVVRDDDLLYADEHERVTFEEVAVRMTEPMLAAYRRLVMPASLSVDRAFVDAVRERYVLSRPLSAPLAAFCAPVSLVCGRDDHWVGYEDAARLLRLLPEGELHVVEGSGHLLPLEAPARLGEHLRALLVRSGA